MTYVEILRLVRLEQGCFRHSKNEGNHDATSQLRGDAVLKLVCYNEKYLRLQLSILFHRALDSGASRLNGDISSKCGRFITNCMSISICLLIRLKGQDR